MKKAAAYAVLLVTAYFFFFGGDYSFLDLWRLKRQHQQELVELEAVRAQVAELEQKADSLAHDSATLERLAREQYGLIKEGERLYRFAAPEDSTEAAQAP